jgi:HD superfamily phosphodiesterase
LPQKRINHSEAVADFAFRLAWLILCRNPNAPIDAPKVRVAALLHDIGRSQAGDHELNSIAILHELGHPDLAELVPHGSIYEIEKMRGHDRPELLPHTLENKIVAYADARVRFEPITLQQRMADIRNRRADDTQKMATLAESMERYEKIEAEISALCGGRID